MNFLSLVGVELKKIRRSKILLILLIPVIMMWIPSIINADMNFDLRGIPITPENNFFIQGFMGMVWFMIPASLVICTVLLNQTERSNKGILKMLSLPISTTKLCLAKFTVLILLAAFQMVMSIGAYYICAAIVTHTQDYNFILEPLYVCKNVCSIYAAAIPMAAVYLAVSTLIQSPIFSVGIGLASIVPSVLMINTKIWFAYPMSYPFYLIMRMGELRKVFMKHKSLGFRGCLLQSESLFWHLSYPVCDTAHLKGDNYNEKQNFNCDFYHYALCPMDDPATAYL